VQVHPTGQWAFVVDRTLNEVRKFDIMIGSSG